MFITVMKKWKDNTKIDRKVDMREINLEKTLRLLKSLDFNLKVLFDHV